MAAALIMVALAASGAQAQDRPQTTPTRDVDITYLVTRGGQTLRERTRWLAAEQEERVDPPGPEDAYVVIDHRTRNMAMVNSEAKTVLDMVAPPAGPLDPESDARFTRGDDATVAGLGCTEWDAAAGNLPPTTLCLTADGVLLRLRSGTITLAEAIAVQYGPEDPATFRIPTGYRHMAPQVPVVP